MQKKWIKNWSLHNARGRGLLLCNLRRASAKLRKYFGQQAVRAEVAGAVVRTVVLALADRCRSLAGAAHHGLGRVDAVA